MINANTARLQTLEAIETNTQEAIDCIYKNIAAAIKVGDFATKFSVHTVGTFGNKNIVRVEIYPTSLKCDLKEVIDFFESQGFECTIDAVNLELYRVDRFLRISWK